MMAWVGAVLLAASESRWWPLGLLIALTTTFTGCTPSLVTKAPDVPVVIEQHCVSAADVPTLPPTNCVPNGTARQNAACTAADADQARQVAGDAIATLRQCAAP